MLFELALLRERPRKAIHRLIVAVMAETSLSRSAVYSARPNRAIAGEADGARHLTGDGDATLEEHEGA